MRTPELTVITGPVKAEKSTELLYHIRRALRARVRIDVAVPQLDTRSAGRVLTHNGATSELYGVVARVVPSAPQETGVRKASSASWYMTRDIQATHCLVDEAQFFDPHLPLYVSRLLEGGVSVTVSGLDLDSDGIPFDPMPALLSLATTVKKLTAVCECGANAVRTRCRVPKEGTILVGADEYEPKCLRCWAETRRA